MCETAVKLNPPPKPQINFSTVSWYPQVSEHQEILLYTSQLQWKQEDQSWSVGIYFVSILICECINECVYVKGFVKRIHAVWLLEIRASVNEQT